MRSLYQIAVNYSRKIDWTLLLFLIIVLNVKMLIKIPALVLLVFLNRKALLDKKNYRQGFVLFYFSMIAVAIINLLLHVTSLSLNHFVAISIGIVFWLLCIAATFLNYQFVAKNDIARLNATLTSFFVLNAAVTIAQLLLVMWASGSVNPYAYQGMHQKYFINTGDMMTGITFDVSTTNAIISSFAVIYFLYFRKPGLVLLCMGVLLLTTSNFTNILLLLVLFLMFFFRSTRVQKSTIVVCLSLLAIFMVKISPQNEQYVKEAFEAILGEKKSTATVAQNRTALTERPDSLLTAEEQKKKIAILFLDSVARARTGGIPVASQEKPEIPKPNIHSEPYWRKKDTTDLQRKLLEFATESLPDFDTSLNSAKARNLPGKLIAFQQTISYFKRHPLKITTGAGIGSFSSKLAFRSSGLHIAGGYPQRFSYIDDDFLHNHLELYLNYFSKDMELHSLIHSPNSVYDQLIAEYGLAGLVAFFLFYLLFVFKRTKKLTYAFPIFLILLGAFGVEYWYEQLSIVILFELMILMDIKQVEKQHA